MVKSYFSFLLPICPKHAQKIVNVFFKLQYLQEVKDPMLHGSSGKKKKKKVKQKNIRKNQALGFPGGSVVKNLPANAGDTSSILGLGRSHKPQNN